MRFGAHMPMNQNAEQSQGGSAQGGQGQGQGGGQRRRGHLRQHGGVGMLLHHADEFGLGAKDVEALEALQEKHELEKAKLEYEEKAAKIKFRHIMRRPNAKEADVRAAAQAVANAELDLRMMRFKHLKAAGQAVKGSSGKVIDVKAFMRRKRARMQQGGEGGGGGKKGGRA